MEAGAPLSADDLRHLATPATYRPAAEPSAPRAEASAVRLYPGRITTLVLPYPPSVNDVWRIFTPKGGRFPARIIKTKVAREYRERLLEVVGDLQPLDGPVEVVGTVYRPRRVGDLDNALKVLLDALKGVAFHDDKQVVHIDLTRDDDKDRPRVEVQVRPLEVKQGRLL